MMTTSLFVLLAMQLLGYSGFGIACEPADDMFDVLPMDKTVQIGTNVTFNCMLKDNGVETWQYKLLNSTRLQIVSSLLNNESAILGFMLSLDGSLIIPDVQPHHAGIYFCGRAGDGRCSNATLKVQGPPEISFGNDTYYVDTGSNLSVTRIINGYPRPTVTVLREVDGTFRPINDSRINFSFIGANLTIIISRVRKADNGRYRILARASKISVDDNFTIFTRGPDPPEITVKPVVVSRYNHQATVLCSIQSNAFESDEGVSMEWKDTQDRPVPISDSNPVHSTNFANGSLLLTIKSLNSSLTGRYTCNVTNARGGDIENTRISGPPPPPPEDPTVMKQDGRVTVSWIRPIFDINITLSYNVIVYQAGNDVIVTQKPNVMFPSDHQRASTTFEDLSPGDYEVTVRSSANSVLGDETGRSRFEIAFPVTIVAAVAASVGGLIILLVIASIIGIFCYCSIKARKNQINSQQRTWSEEDKVNQPTAVPNSYTALAVQNTSELPPSPLSPMTSSFGIDPKWEFPRENIQLSDTLAAGQFTVLYKGVAKGLREKPCEVAVKTLADHATEEDLKALLYEMDMLSGIEEHPNIVSLIRVCSVGNPLFVVMEYMCHGDLLGFLRACRGHHGMYTVSPGTRYQPPSLQLCSRDLLTMATKISSGMCYLAERKIVHRALCARNVLVGTGMDVKIYNVGSFDANIESPDGMIKWMAPETLFDGTNTTYSDVWSFGVTLWELVTVGGTPYGEIQPEDLYAQLHNGMRMPCPSHCATEVYTVMKACWEKNPADRPHFAVIHENLDELVMSKLNYLDLRSYNGNAYSQFGDDAPQLSTAL